MKREDDGELAEALVHCNQVAQWGGVFRVKVERVHDWLSELRDLRRERDLLEREVKGLRRDMAPPGARAKRKAPTRREAARRNR